MIVGKLKDFASKFSLGLVLLLGWGFMYLNVEDIYPTNSVAMRGVLTAYLLFTALIFSIDSIAGRKGELALFRVGFLKETWKFGLGALIGLVVLYAFGFLLKGSALPTIKTAILSIGAGVILVHALFISIFEELVFRGRFPAELRYRGMSETLVWIVSAVIFAGFHWALSKTIWSLVIYIPLGMLFMAVSKKWSPNTQMANAGIHFAWNIFILGFMSVT